MKTKGADEAVGGGGQHKDDQKDAATQPLRVLNPYLSSSSNVILYSIFIMEILCVLPMK